MPYIKSELRDELETNQFVPNNGGELNYFITKVIWEYYQAHGSKYSEINDVLGALEGAKLEFYRRVAVPYEDQKMKENGDVYV
jgi:hypothetical protein